jgi:hypothetical protein
MRSALRGSLPVKRRVMFLLRVGWGVSQLSFVVAEVWGHFRNAEEEKCMTLEAVSRRMVVIDDISV